MEVVEKFLSLRREGKGSEAFEMLAPGASLGCPWGTMHHGGRVRDILVDEGKFVKKGYLDPVPIERIDDSTFQRKFKWDRGISENGNGGRWGLRWLPMWREIYFVQDGKILLVTSDKLKREATLSSLVGLLFGREASI